jgi:glutathione S-transferase
MDQPFLHYGSEASYYAGKSRAYLRWKRVPMRDIQVERRDYLETIIPLVGRPVIPVVRTPDGAVLQDTSNIFDAIEKLLPEPSATPAGPRQRLAAALMEVFGDEWLMIPAIHYRWNKNKDWIIEEFVRIVAPDLPTEAERRHRGLKRAQEIQDKTLVNLGVVPAMHAAIEQAYEGFLREFDAHLAQWPYLLGERPSIGDFGLIGPLYGHQYRDPASGAHMRAVAPRVVDWVERMIAPDNRAYGSFLPDDAIPQSVIPLLQRFFREAAPVFESTARIFTSWVARQGAAIDPQADLPRIIGRHRFTLEGVEGERSVYPYHLWMMQRPLDLIAHALPADRRAIRNLLASVGGQGLLRFPLFPRLTFRNFKLVLEGPPVASAP